MRKSRTATIGIACAMALVTAACGSDDEAGGGSNEVAEGETIKVGVLGSISGPNAPSYPGFKTGVDARLQAYENDDSAACDLEFEVVEGDDMTSEQGNLQAAQQLIEQEQVFSILTASTTLAASTDYLETTGADVPVIGFPLDGPADAWYSPDNNFFKVTSVPQPGQVFSTTGEFFEQAGATSVASVAFNVEPALVAMRATAASAEAAGLEDALQYGNIELSTGDVSGAVNAIIDSGADGVWAAVTPEIATQLVAALKQRGFDGVINLPIGYGGDLLANANQAAAAEGVYFGTPTAPVELESEATEALVSALQAGGSESSIPTNYESAGYLTADLLIDGIEEAGCNPTSQEFIDTVRSSSDWDADGLLPRPQDFTNPEVTTQCTFFVQLQDGAFVPMSDEPICGEEVDS